HSLAGQNLRATAGSLERSGGLGHPSADSNRRMNKNSRGGIRTPTGLKPQGILSPLCLPFHHAADWRVLSRRFKLLEILINSKVYRESCLSCFPPDARRMKYIAQRPAVSPAIPSDIAARIRKRHKQ